MPEKPKTRILFLSSSSCGKSTIFKTIRLLTNSNPDQSNDEMFHQECTHAVRQNCVAGMLVLLKKSQELYDEDPVKYSSCLVNMDDNTICDIQTIVDFGSETFTESEWNNISNSYQPKPFNYDAMNKLGQSISNLWNLDAIQTVFRQTDKYSFPDNMDFFFDKIIEIMDKTYASTKEDYLKVRIRTTGLIEWEYMIGNKCIRMFDVGSTRNERKKWMYNYSTGSPVNYVMYLCALNFYCKVLFEDEKYNALQENINLFEAICNGTAYKTVSHNQSLQNSHLILVLTKPDIFIESLKSVPLSVCFGDEYTGRNYTDTFDALMCFKQRYDYSVDFKKINMLMKIILGDDTVQIPVDITNIVCHFVDLSELSVKAAYDDGVKFITDKLLSRNKVNRNIDVFVVNATVSKEVSDMMNKIYDTIIPPNT